MPVHPFCIAAVCKAANLPTAPANSAWPGSGCDNVFSGVKCTAQCATNYAGTVTSTCTNGVWGPATGTCVLQGMLCHAMTVTFSTKMLRLTSNTLQATQCDPSWLCLRACQLSPCCAQLDIGRFGKINNADTACCIQPAFTMHAGQWLQHCVLLHMCCCSLQGSRPAYRPSRFSLASRWL